MGRTPPAEVQRLIELFQRNYEVYTSGKYNETQLRREFLDPFFEALGWDVSNKRGIAEQYKEVIHEDAIKIHDTTKAPDYCFRVGSERKFFVEAKKPSVNIKEDSNPAYQIRRYAWSAKLPLSILTDFDEFAVYDCRSKPKPNDKASVARVLYFKFDELDKHWEELHSIFSREAVWQGSFDKYADDAKSKRGTSEVDEEFLKELETWREVLAKNLVLRNKKLTSSELNYAVQRILDRILFFRISEDRGIEESKRLSETLKEKEIYKSVCEMFLEADDKYNSGLFHFHKTNSRPTPPDELSLQLKVDNQVLKSIIEGLYYPNCPYEFSVMPVEILGQVYEKFLGKEISVSNSQKISITEKPLVKKAGGVFYTPAYIVNKIVKDTLEPLIKDKNPKSIENITVLDPSCGSGSFLLGAYDYLLQWHLNWYIDNNPNKSKAIYRNAKGEWALSPKEKKRILLNNIYGVDIDAQAVETTKLSLCLKVLEGETKESVNRQLSLFKEQALPDIGDNIKCGNSLVGFDLELDKLTKDELYKINPFDWKKEFKNVFENAKGGFDAIVGNPPYLRVQGLNEFHGNEIAYYSNKYKCAVKRFDLYLLFIERCYDLLSAKGTLGFICPHKFINSDFGSGIRHFLTENRAISKLINFDSNLVFEQASTYTCLLYLNKKKNDHLKFVDVPPLKEGGIKKFLSSLEEKDFQSIQLSGLGEDKWSFNSGSSAGIFDLTKSDKFTTLGECVDQIMQGIVTGNDDTHILYSCRIKGKTITGYSEALKRDVSVERDLVKPLLTGKNVKRNSTSTITDYCLYPYKLENGKTRILEEDEFKKIFPLGYEYLSEFKKELRQKKIKYKTNSKYWYSLHRSRKIDSFERQTVVTPEISLGNNMTLAKSEHFHNSQVYSFLQKEDDPRTVYFWLGLLNSDFVWWYITETGTVLRGGYFRFKEKYLSTLPVPKFNSKNRAFDEISERSKELYELSISIDELTVPSEIQFAKRKLLNLESQVNKLVLDLYGFSEEERKLISSTNKSKGSA